METIIKVISFINNHRFQMFNKLLQNINICNIFLGTGVIVIKQLRVFLQQPFVLT